MLRETGETKERIANYTKRSSKFALTTSYTFLLKPNNK